MKNINKRNLLLVFINFILVFSSAQAETRQRLVEGKLAPCPDKPNCVSTETNDFTAIKIATYPAHKVWHCLKLVVTELGGEFKESDEEYFWSTFESSLLKFTDDVEARLDIKNNLIHIRSASRVGYYDFNTNENRLKQIINSVNRKLIADKMINKSE